MKRTLPLLLAAVLIAGLGGCVKDKFDKNNSKGGMLDEAVHFEHTVNVSSTDYERVEVEALAQEQACDAYHDGIIEYRKGDEVEARVEFNKTDRHRSHCMDRHGDRERQLRKEAGRDSEFTKVVVEPLVKTDDCDYLVAGSICFYDKSNNWVATIDFGDGTCDDIATKTTADDITTFSISEWLHKHNRK